MQTHEVFLLTAEFLDEGDRGQVRLFGKSATLGAVQLLFDDAPPLFFVDRDEKLPALDFQFERKPVKLAAFSGRPVDALYFKSFKEMRQAGDRFRATGVRHFEADVRPEDRFLMERFINTRAVVAGEGEKQDALTLFRNPKIKAGKAAPPPLAVASIDIETGFESGKLYSIAAHLKEGERVENRVFMLADRREDLPDDLALYPTEAAVLQAFLDWFRQADPDLIIGWHVIGFDLMFLERKCASLGLDFALGRDGSQPVLVEKPGRGFFADIAGRVVLDGPPTLRGNGFTFPNYKLETVAQSLLGEGKLIAATDGDKIAEIERQFREDKPALARYNLEDCVLTARIFEETELMPLLLQRAFFAGPLLGKLNLPNLPLDHYYLPRLHREGLVAPNAEDAHKEEAEAGEVGVLESVAGIHEGVETLAIRNLYPTLIQTFHIEPLAQVMADEEPVATPAGFRFSSRRSLLPALLERLIQRAAQARASDDGASAKAAQMQLESLPRSLQAKNCRFYHPELADALHKTADWLLRESTAFLESRGARVLLADPESIFLAPGDAQGDGRALAAALRDYWTERLRRELNAESQLIVERAGRFRQLVLPRPRAKEDSRTKRYAGLFEAGAGDARILKVGLESAIAGPWTELASQLLEALFQAFFAGEEIEPWLRDFANRLKDGAMDDRLAYQRRIAKPLEEYSKTSPPPHIRAARMLEEPVKRIAYVWTKRGPVPTALEPTDLDYEHYLQKQIAPIADLLLDLQGKSFKSLTEPEQITLF